MLRNLTVIVLSVGCAYWATSQAASDKKNDNSDALHDLANLLHNRLVGVPAQGETLKKMIELLASGETQKAALVATEHPFFYDYKLRALFTPWSNRAGNVSTPLKNNDMVITMVGMVRDDVPFNQVLSGDFFYRVGTEKERAERLEKQGSKDVSLLTSPSMKDALVQDKQSEKYTGNNEQGAVSGVLSSHAFGAAFYSAGTNRRATAFVLKNFLCHEIEQLHDTSTPKNWVRQDVDRSPSGDPDMFNERCVGCHAGMDALSGWSVYYDFNNRLRYNEGQVQGKIFKNNLLTIIDTSGKEKEAPDKDEGRNYNLEKNKNDEFTNLWTEGKNASLGWRGETSGKGAKEFGEMITRSKAFSSCMAKQVYQAVCYLDPEENETAKAKRDALATQFEADDYNMRKLFAATAVACLTKSQAKEAGSGENRNEKH